MLLISRGSLLVSTKNCQLWKERSCDGAEKARGKHSAGQKNLKGEPEGSLFSRKAIPTMAKCVACHKPLTLYIAPDEEDEDETMGGSASANTGSYVDDDVQLQCGCHFHWSVRLVLLYWMGRFLMLTFGSCRQCLLDSYSMSECPNCGRNLITSTPSGEQQLLCNLKNEGGLQERLDMLPILTEESYLKAYPEERRCRAFLEFCGEGDVEAIVDLLNDDAGEEDEERSVQGVGHSIDVLRYRDQIGSMGSGLHVAVQNQRMEVAWLLLLLASTLKIDQIPAMVLQAAHNSGIQREDQSGRVDIRLLKDSQGMTAEHRAAGIGGLWTEWLQSGRLKPPAS